MPGLPPDLPVRVGVWELIDGADWRRVRAWNTWEALSCEPRDRQAGPWSCSGPYDEQALTVSKTRLLTFDWLQEEGAAAIRMMTGRVEARGPTANETGKLRFEASGSDVVSLLNGALCYPDPGNGPNAQTVTHYQDTDVAETALRRLIMANWVERLGQGLAIPGSSGSGGEVNLNERFSNLFEVVMRKARRGGLGVRMGLEDTSGTRATLRLRFFEPETKEWVKVSRGVGTLQSWKQTDVAPTGTRALILGPGKGLDRMCRRVSKDQPEAEWGWPHELLVDARDVTEKDLPKDATQEQKDKAAAKLEDALLERGEEALEEAAEQSSFELESAMTEGVKPGRDFWVTDRVTVEPLPGVKSVERISALQFGADRSGVSVKLVPGDPDAADSRFAQARLITALREELRRLQREES